VQRETDGMVAMEKLLELERDGVLGQIPRGSTGELASVGSLRHASQDCSPCAYWFKGLCKYSICCTYCHLMHDCQKSKRLRPSKQARMRMRRWEAQKVESRERCGSDEEQGEEGAGRSDDDSAFHPRRVDSLQALGIPSPIPEGFILHL
jgi:hypothetical protein